MCNESFSIMILNYQGFFRLITNGTHERDIEKTSIKGVSVIRNSVVKLDLGCSGKIFIPYIHVIEPLGFTADSLRSYFVDLVSAAHETSGGGGGGGSFNEDLVIEANNHLSAIKTNTDNSMVYLNEIKLDIEEIRQEVIRLNKPARRDETNPMMIYEGFTESGVDTAMPVYAIRRIKTEGPIVKIEWAFGYKSFVNSWDDRTTLFYL